MEFFLFYLIPISAGITFLISLTTFIPPAARFYLRLLCLYLLLDCIVETYTSYQALHIHNTQLVNILREIIHSLKARKALLYCLWIFPLISVMNIFLIQKYVYQSITYSLGCLLIVAFSIYYFWEVFQSKSYVNLAREPAFWICSGLLFFSACSFPVYAFLNLLQNLGPTVSRVMAFLMDLVNILLYLSFIIAFLCRLRPRKST